MPTEDTISFKCNAIYSYPTFNDRGENLLRQIAAICQEVPPQYELLMDGTFAMMERSFETACATTLHTPIPLPIPDSSTVSSSRPTQPIAPDPPAPNFKWCRKCAGEYVFSLPSDGGDVMIIGGAPNFNDPHAQSCPYKTMSYVWGTLPPSPISVPCLSCGQTTHIPMLSVQRFYNLMSLGGGGNTIWLDAVSIDQADPVDVANHIGIMGQIYKNSRCVSVLLPASDRSAFECLDFIEHAAKIILTHQANFVQNMELTMGDPVSGNAVNVLSMVCQMFLENIQNLASHLHQFAYWSRAWTFQEWALAPDLEIALEGWEKAETCFNLKSLVLGAAMLISRYKILQNQDAEIKLGTDISRGLVPPIFHIVKSLFPDEDLFLSYDKIDVKQASFQTNFLHHGITHLLGICSVPLPSSTSSTSDAATPHSMALISHATPFAQLRARLILLLSSFSLSKRSAKYEADLVACWVSMCNIAYAYDRDDDFTTAKHKVINALRSQGMVVYEFFPDSPTHSHNAEVEMTPVDLFRMYAKEHQQLNATNNAEFPGAPMFTGRADTVMHLIFSLNHIRLPTQWSDSSPFDDNAILYLHGAILTDTLALDVNDLSQPLRVWKERAIYGYVPGLQGFQFWNAHDTAKVYLERLSVSRQKMGKLVILRILFYKCSPPDTMESTPLQADIMTNNNYANPCNLYLSAIIPSDICTDDLKVCREPINGSLVTVVKDKYGCNHIVAYLVLSDHLSGSYLVCPDREGKIDMDIRVQERGDMTHTVYRQLSVRRLYGNVRLSDTWPESVYNRGGNIL